MNKSQAQELDGRSRHLRRLVVRAVVEGGRGHVGSAMSLIEILRVLYDEVLKVRAGEPDWPDRDRCILSKGHGCLALYAVLADKGFFPLPELDRFSAAGGILGGHPEHGKVPGVEASTGALGHGLSIGLGMALGCRLKGRKSRVVVILGDGEIDEGAVWEAAMTAAKYKLANLTAIIDCNKLQSYGPTAEVLDLEPLADKWRAFGFETVECDGHDVAALRKVLANPLSGDRPGAVICHTVKGKGIPMAEHDAAWHHKNKLTPDEVAAITEALGAA